jgi:hypothetical protein
MSNDALVGRTAALEVIAMTQFAFNNPPGGRGDMLTLSR